VKGLQIPVEGGEEPWHSNAKEDVHGITAGNLHQTAIKQLGSHWNLGE